MILHQGRIVYEKYANGYDKDRRHVTWSVSKSFLNAIVGIAVREGKLSLDDSICKFQEVSWFPRAEHCDVRVRHLLEFRSGLAWKETYEGSDDPTSSDVLQMLYDKGSRDMGRYVAAKSLVCKPDECWNYSSGDSNYLGLVLKWIYRADYPRLLQKELFDKLGMSTAIIEADRSGTFVFSSYVHASPRDLARFGQLYLRDGVWNGERLLPRGWVAYSSSTHMSGTVKNFAPGGGNGAASFWSNRPVPEHGFPISWKDAPSDTFAALGHWGQRVFVVPSRSTVLVRLGDTRDGSFDDNEFLRLGLAVATSKSVLP